MATEGNGGLLGPGLGVGLNAFVYALVGLHVIVLVRTTLSPFLSYLSLHLGGCTFLQSFLLPRSPWWRLLSVGD